MQPLSEQIQPPCDHSGISFYQISSKPRANIHFQIELWQPEGEDFLPGCSIIFKSNRRSSQAFLFRRSKQPRLEVASPTNSPHSLPSAESCVLSTSSRSSSFSSSLDPEPSRRSTSSWMSTTPPTLLNSHPLSACPRPWTSLSTAAITNRRNGRNFSPTSQWFR